MCIRDSADGDDEVVNNLNDRGHRHFELEPQTDVDDDGYDEGGQPNDRVPAYLDAPTGADVLDVRDEFALAVFLETDLGVLTERVDELGLLLVVQLGGPD